MTNPNPFRGLGDTGRGGAGVKALLPERSGQGQGRGRRLGWRVFGRFQHGAQSSLELPAFDCCRADREVQCSISNQYGGGRAAIANEPDGM